MKKLLISLLVASVGVSACKPEDASNLSNSITLSVSASVEHRALERIEAFWQQPEDCDEFFSKEYYCDGYTQLNLPMGEGSPNLTDQIKTSTAPDPGFIGMQVLGEFDKDRPTVIYVHGWNVEKPSQVFGLPDQWVQQAQKAGFNMVQFHWSKLAFDNTKNCPGLNGFIVGNIPCQAGFEFFKASGASDYFIDAYRKLFDGYQQPVRLVSQSLGVGLAIFSAYRMYEDPSLKDLMKPNRLDLIDPYIMVGVGSRRNRSFDGQIPPNEQLPKDYQNNIVNEFVPGSSCTSRSRGFKPENLYSQYCQIEGMLYRLVSEHELGLVTYSSIVGGLTAYDFRKLGAFQAFADKAFNYDLTSRHTSPNAAYMYSFSASGSKEFLSAATSDEKIRELTKKVLSGRRHHLRQTAGFDTITLFDDAYREVK